MFVKREGNLLKVQAILLAVLFFTLNTAIGSSLVSYTATVTITPITAGPYTLYAHQETYGPYHYFRLYSADSSGETHSGQTDSEGLKSMGYFIFELTGITAINASTWTFYYRAQKTHSAVEAHCTVDILIRKSDGGIRQWIAVLDANSGELSASWSTLSGTYAFAGYSVVDQTDYLEVDYYIWVTAKRNGERVNLRIDDSALALADQTRIENIVF